MGRVDQPVLRGTVLGQLLRLSNPIFKWLLRSPLHWPWSTFALVLEFTGRKTGRNYSTPANYVEDGSRLLVTSSDRWSRNLSGGAPVKVWLRGKPHSGTADLVEDRLESVAVHRQMIEKRPIFGRLIGVRPPGEEQQLRRAIDAGRRAVVVRLR